jgi:hypothetical protein
VSLYRARIRSTSAERSTSGGGGESDASGKLSGADVAVDEGAWEDGVVEAFSIGNRATRARS